MTVLGTAIVKIDGDDRGLDKSFANTKQKAEGFTGSLKRMAETAGGFLLGGVVVKGVDALKSSFTSSIGLASSLAESQSKVNIVFKDSAGAIGEFAKQGPKALGMSNAAALEALGTFGNFLTAMEQTPESAASMSKSMVQLATDMGSFNNANPADVLLALRAGLSGEAEPLKRFGVALSENAIKLEANKLGLKGVNGALTESEKIQARYSIIMRQTASAQGDFERTSNGLANRQKILGAQIEDLKTKFGAVLLPAMTAVFGFLIDVGIPALERFGGFVGDVAGKISSVFGELRHLFSLGLGGGQIGGELTAIQTAAFQLGTFFRTVVIPAFNDAKQAIQLFFLVLQGGDAGGQLTGLQQKAMALGVSVREMWQRDIQPAIVALGSIVTQVVSSVKEHWSTLGPIFKFVAEFIIARIEGLLQKISGVVQVVSGVVRLIDAVIHGEWANAWQALKDIATGMLDILIGEIKFAFGNIPEILWNAGYDAMMGLIDGIKNRFNAFKSTISDIANAIPNTVKSILGIDSPSRVMHGHGMSIMQGLGAGMQQGFDQYAEPVVAGVMAKMNARFGDFSGTHVGNLLPQNLWVSGTDSTDPRNWSGTNVGHYIPTYKGRAQGGTAFAGQPHIVGERGWESFVPAVDGRILSHSDAMKSLAGGGGATTLNIESIVLPNVHNAEQLYAELKRIEQRELRLARAGIRSS